MSKELLFKATTFNWPLYCPACGHDRANVYHDPVLRTVDDMAECSKCLFTFRRIVPHVCPMCEKIWECDAGTCQHAPEVQAIMASFMNMLQDEFKARGIIPAGERTLPLAPREVLDNNGQYCPECEVKLIDDMFEQIK